jgi:hypothetical protein
MRIINSITRDTIPVVTTSFAHQYATGIIVRMDIPRGFGMEQLNGLSFPIIVTGPTTFTIDIDTRFFDSFLAPVSYPYSYQSAQVVPMGEINEMLTSAVRNVLPY